MLEPGTNGNIPQPDPLHPEGGVGIDVASGDKDVPTGTSPDYNQADPNPSLNDNGHGSEAELANLEIHLSDIASQLARAEQAGDHETMQKLRAEIASIVNTRPQGHRKSASHVVQRLLVTERAKISPKPLRRSLYNLAGLRNSERKDTAKTNGHDKTQPEGDENQPAEDINESILETQAANTSWEDKFDKLIEDIKTENIIGISANRAVKKLERELEAMARRGELTPEDLETSKKYLTMAVEEAWQEVRGPRPTPKAPAGSVAGTPSVVASPNPYPASRRVARQAPGLASQASSPTPAVTPGPEVLPVPEDKAALAFRFKLLKEEYFASASDPLRRDSLREEIGTLLQRLNPGIDNDEKVQQALGQILSADAEQKFHSEKEQKALAKFNAAKEKVASLQDADEREAAVSELNDAVDSRIAVTGEDRAAVEHELDVYFLQQYDEKQLHDLIEAKAREYPLGAAEDTSLPAYVELRRYMNAAAEIFPKSKLLTKQREIVTGLLRDESIVMFTGTQSRHRAIQPKQPFVQDSGERQLPRPRRRMVVGSLALAATLGIGAIFGSVNNNSAETAQQPTTSALEAPDGIGEATPTTPTDQATTAPSAEVTATVAAPATAAGEEGPDEGGEDGEPDEDETTTTAAPAAPPSSDVPIAPIPSPDQPPAPPVAPATPETPPAPEGKVGIYETVNINGAADEQGNRWLWHYVEEYVGEQVGTDKIADDDKLGQRFVAQAVQDIIKYNGGRSSGQIDIPTDIILNAADGIYNARGTS